MTEFINFSGRFQFSAKPILSGKKLIFDFISFFRENPGVCHGDDLWHVFDWRLPLIMCDLKPIIRDFVGTATGCVMKNITGLNVDYATCLTNPDSAFVKNSGECIKAGFVSVHFLEVSFCAAIWQKNQALEIFCKPFYEKTSERVS